MKVRIKSNKMFDYGGFCICVVLYTIGVLIFGATITAGIFMLHVAIVPLLFRYSKGFRRNLIFPNFVQWPLNVDFEDPKASGIEGARNLSIEYFSKVDRCSIKIGIWHILPNSSFMRMKGSFENLDKEVLHRRLDEELATTKLPIVLYCHGNANCRAASHRIELYRFFQKMEYHTIAFDYRGYGDSTNTAPSEEGVIEDALMVYEWLYNTTEKGGRTPNIYVWGHSLGTGISSHLLGRLDELSASVLERPVPLPLPKALILEAPFNNLADEVNHHPLTKLVKWLPYFDYCFVAPFRYCSRHSFRSAAHLSRVRNLPVLILHAEDDMIVPIAVGRKLYKSILDSRSEGGSPVVMHIFEKSEGLGHKFICQAEDLNKVVGQICKRSKKNLSNQSQDDTFELGPSHDANFSGVEY